MQSSNAGRRRVAHSSRSFGYVGLVCAALAASAQGQTLPAPPTSPTPVTNYEYDAEGNPTKAVLAPASRALTTKRAYDSLGRRTSTTDARNGLVQFSYDLRDEPTGVKDPRQLTTTYNVDGMGQVRQLTSPDTGVTTRTYDAAGNLKTSTDARGVLATYTYDALNRLTRLEYSQNGGPSSRWYSWKYDRDGANVFHPIGRLAVASSPDGASLFQYDALGRVVMTIQVHPSTNAIPQVNYTYTGAQLTSVSYPSRRVVTFGWADGQIDSISVTGGGVVTPLLDNVTTSPFGAIQSWTWRLGGTARAHERVYDTNGRLVRHPLGHLVRDITYDDADRISRYTHYTAGTAQTAPSFDQSFSYDELNRLQLVTGSTSWSYAYDANGNRTASSVGAVARGYSVAATSNRLDALTNPARSMGYDTTGNTLSDVQSGSAANYTATYSLEGRLAAMAQGTAAGVEFGYDASGRRFRRSQWAGSPANPRTVTLYAYDQDSHLLGEYDASGKAITEYVWLGDTPVAVIKSDAAAPGGYQVYAIHTDHLDTPRVVLDANGQVRWRWMGEPFGASPAEEQPTASLPALQQSLRFPGQIYEAFGGKHYNHFRDYDPTTGRYVQSDPIGLGGGINTYAYANGNPLMYVDPYGLFGWADMPDVPDWLVDGAAGFGDTLSFGGTGVVRRWMGTDGAVNRCSSAYSNGEWGAIGLSLAFGGAHLGRNALNQMGRAGDLGTRVGRGVGRVFSDGRSWGAVRDTWSVAAGNGERWLAANGQSLHHWLIPQRFAEVNAGFNYMAISAGFNSWMNGSTAFRTAVEWGFRGSVAGIYGAPLTAAVSGDDCTCQK